MTKNTHAGIAPKAAVAFLGISLGVPPALAGRSDSLCPPPGIDPIAAAPVRCVARGVPPAVCGRGEALADVFCFAFASAPAPQLLLFSVLSRDANSVRGPLKELERLAGSSIPAKNASRRIKLCPGAFGGASILHSLVFPCVQ